MLRLKTSLVICISAVVLVSSCNTPTVGFRYTEKRELRVGGHDFVVYFTTTHAQAVRLNDIRLKQADTVAAEAYRAIELASGCQVRDNTMRGDPALITVRIKC